MAAASSSGTRPPQAQPEQFSIHVPKLSEDKSFSVMKFSGVGVDVSNWNDINLEREDNRKVYENRNDMPQFGAGSQYGRAAREEARLKKLGLRARKYKLDGQPWLLNDDSRGATTIATSSKDAKKGRRFKGIKEGGAGEHSDYWIFIKTAAGRFDACKVDSWYQFMPLARYKTLDIDEAEEQFTKRDAVMNEFALKAQMFKVTDVDSEDTKAGIKETVQKTFKISDRDEYASDSDSDDDKEKIKKEVDDDDEQTKKKAAKGKKDAKRKLKREVEEEDEGPARQESDDGDEEGMEVDYISDSGSDSDGIDEPDEDKVEKALVGVDNEKGLRTLLSDNEEDEEEEGNEDKPTTIFDQEDGKKKKPGTNDESGESDSSDSDDPDAHQVQSALFLQDKKLAMSSGSDEVGSSTSSAGLKRPHEDTTAQTIVKRIKIDPDGPITEVAVRHYLERKQMSTKDILAKFKPKDKKMSKEIKRELVHKLADILKQIQPEQNVRNGTLFFSIKPQ